MSKSTPAEMPKWVFLFGCLLAAIGMLSGLIGIVAPTKFFSDFPSFNQWEEISFVTTGWGIRNLAMGAAMIIALWLKLSSAIHYIECRLDIDVLDARSSCGTLGHQQSA